MVSEHFIGKCLSFDGGKSCTVLYIGPLEGSSPDKQWLGVEWDDSTRGKHNGTFNGKEYFKCQSTSHTAGSFLRTTRPTDPEQSFVEAVREKYGETIDDENAETSEITISGKVAQEIGFEKIRAQLSRFHELKIVIVDGRRISHAQSVPNEINTVCPIIEELDLSRNPLHSFWDIVAICKELAHLKKVKINGIRALRLHGPDLDVEGVRLHESSAFDGVVDLEMNDMYLDWDVLVDVASSFRSLHTLEMSQNGLRVLTCPFRGNDLLSLSLEKNDFTCLSDLRPLESLKNLETLKLKGNNISKISAEADENSKEPIVFGSQLTYIDLSENAINSWDFVNSLEHVFPGLNALRISKNPVYKSNTQHKEAFTQMDDAFMLTVARISGLETLNYSKISSMDRTQSELLYLSIIGKEISEAPEYLQGIVIAQHPRYAELYKNHGAPIIAPKIAEVINPKHLEARLITFTFYLPPNSLPGQKEQINIKREIPLSFDVYRVKGLVGSIFGIKPLSLRLMWETGEWDPVAGYEEFYDDSDEDDGVNMDVDGLEIEEDGVKMEVDRVGMKSVDDKTDLTERGKWMRREVEIEDGTRQVSNFVEDSEATVRVELR